MMKTINILTTIALALLAVFSPVQVFAQTIPATATYSCPAGVTLNGTICQPAGVPATSTVSPAGCVFVGGCYNCTVAQVEGAGRYCPAPTRFVTQDGHIVNTGSTCVPVNSGKFALCETLPVYSCQAGYTLSGTVCSPPTYAATVTYSCPAGYTLSGTNCIQNVGTVSVSPNISSSWTITGPATITGSGTSQTSTSKPTGTYTITWGAVAGYTKPISQTLSLVSGSTITFNGVYTASTCPLPWGGTIASGNSTPAYQSAAVVAPATCTSQTRTCTNGTLSGTYINQSCVVSAIKTVSLAPLSSTVTLGQSVIFSAIASFSDSSMTYHNLNWRKQGSPWNWEAAYVPVVTATQSNYIFAATASHNLSTTLTPTQTGTYDVYAAASSDGVTWTSSLLSTITVSTPPLCTAANPSVAWNPCVTVPAQCVGNPSPRDVAGTQSGMCTDGATGTVFRGCTVYGQVCAVVPSAVCGNTICENTQGESLLTCPKDCKAKYQQF